MKNKFNFYEIVRIVSDKPKHAEINGATGVVAGMAQNEETGRWTYGVSIDKLDGLVRRMDEDSLVSIGVVGKREDFYTGESIKVRVDPKTGEGYIVDDE